MIEIRGEAFDLIALLRHRPQRRHDRKIALEIGLQAAELAVELGAVVGVGHSVGRSNHRWTQMNTDRPGGARPQRPCCRLPRPAPPEPEARAFPSAQTVEDAIVPETEHRLGIEPETRGCKAEAIEASNTGTPSPASVVAKEAARTRRIHEVETFATQGFAHCAHESGGILAP